MKPLLKITAGVVTATVATAAALLATNAAGAQNHSDVIYAYGTPGLNGPGGTIIVTGAIGDYGPTTKANQAGHPDPQGAYSLLELQRGTVLLDGSALQQKIAAGTPKAQIDPVSCSLHGSVTARSPIVAGTGAYTGIKGTLEVTFTIAELASRTPTGACDTNSDPVDAYATIYSTGKVTHT
jgi:hypothetical protein